MALYKARCFWDIGDPTLCLFITNAEWLTSYIPRAFDHLMTLLWPMTTDATIALRHRPGDDQQVKRLLKNNRLILMEAAIVEPLRRLYGVELHDTLVNAPLIYDPRGGDLLGQLYQGYIDIAHQFGLPILICTPTWRASRSRVAASHVNTAINIDAVRFMRAIGNSRVNRDVVIKIGGMIGCKNDGYKPDQGLCVSEAQEFHAWQIEQLVQGGVDFLIAETVPNVDEALGMAKAMAPTGVPYVISFVISRDGCVLDGISLYDAVTRIDADTTCQPLGYMVNCAYPSFLCPTRQPMELFNRLIGYQANASSLDHTELDNAENLEADTLSEWGDLMVALHQRYGVQILGGCCGTHGHHLRYIAKWANQGTRNS